MICGPRCVLFTIIAGVATLGLTLHTTHNLVSAVENSPHGARWKLVLALGTMKQGLRGSSVCGLHLLRA